MLKYLTEHHGAALASWLLGRPIGTRIRLLKNELSLQPIRADWLALYDLEEEILHVEFETDPAKSDVPLPLRMLDYFVRLYRLYRKPVRQVVIVLHQTGVEIPDEFRVGETYHRFRVIRIWEQDAAPLLAEEGLLPLAVLARSDKPEKLLREVAERVQNIAQPDMRADLTAAAFMLGGLRFDKKLLRSLFREEIMIQSSSYQDVVKRSEKRGERRGVKRGENLGRIKWLKDSLLLRFGVLSESIQAALEKLNSADQVQLILAQLDFKSIDDLSTWLEQHQSHNGAA
ncbi:MAG: Rpn family recombination-promoting nuclease/putative transposase [Acidobacteria bacterium]|nr:Rpn family recombination-promoting nuclease/putative transposase [Acidobacteriota bacterium]